MRTKASPFANQLLKHHTFNKNAAQSVEGQDKQPECLKVGENLQSKKSTYLATFKLKESNC